MWFLCLCVCLLSVYTPALGNFGWDVTTPLDEYIARVDNTYSWRILETHQRTGVTFYIVNMTSQTWMNSNFTDRTVWYHFLTIMVPDTIAPQSNKSAFMFIDGGRNGRSPPDIDDNLILEMVGEFANETQAVGAYLQMIPNQPIVFHDDPPGRRRSEDDAIAYTWRRYVTDMRDTPEVLLQFPMTKGAVRALDTIAAVVAQFRPGIQIDQFMATGGSKRGWITWLLGATDRRMMGIGPIVMSLLNFRPTLQAHFMAYDGGWSFAFGDYYNENLTRFLPTPDLDFLAQQVDVYSYRPRLNMTKMIFSATADEFFRPSESHFFFDDLPEPKYMRLLPNAQHAVFNVFDLIYDNLKSLWIAYHTGWELPTMNWTRTSSEPSLTGSITLQASRRPLEVRAWDAQTSDTRDTEMRDWRWLIGEFPWLNPVFWDDEEPVEERPNNVYHAELETEQRWRGFFLEAEFAGPIPGLNLTLTTELNVIPDTYPRGPCTTPDECQGRIV